MLRRVNRDWLLENLHANGAFVNGIEVDHARAYFWWQIAANRNAPGAAQNMFRLEQEISQSDLARGRDYLAACNSKTLRQCRP